MATHCYKHNSSSLFFLPLNEGLDVVYIVIESRQRKLRCKLEVGPSLGRESRRSSYHLCLRTTVWDPLRRRSSWSLMFEINECGITGHWTSCQGVAQLSVWEPRRYLPNWDTVPRTIFSLCGRFGPWDSTWSGSHFPALTGWSHDINPDSSSLFNYLTAYILIDIWIEIYFQVLWSTLSHCDPNKISRILQGDLVSSINQPALSSCCLSASLAKSTTASTHANQQINSLSVIVSWTSSTHFLAWSCFYKLRSCMQVRRKLKYSLGFL